MKGLNPHYCDRLLREMAALEETQSNEWSELSADQIRTGIAEIEAILHDFLMNFGVCGALAVHTDETIPVEPTGSLHLFEDIMLLDMR